MGCIDSGAIAGLIDWLELFYSSHCSTAIGSELIISNQDGVASGIMSNPSNIPLSSRKKPDVF